MCDSALRKHTKGDLKYSQREADRGVGKWKAGAEQLNGWLGCVGGSGREEVKGSHFFAFGKMFYKQLKNIDGILLPASPQIA